MDYKNIIKDSIETSVSLKLFKNNKDASYYHIFNSKLEKIPMSIFKKKVDNFNPDRLKKKASEAYPINNRPRGQDDLKSVNYYKRQMDIPAIWVLKKNNKYILLDGAHRIVANYIKKKKIYYGIYYLYSLNINN